MDTIYINMVRLFHISCISLLATNYIISYCLTLQTPFTYACRAYIQPLFKITLYFLNIILHTVHQVSIYLLNIILPCKIAYL